MNIEYEKLCNEIMLGREIDLIVGGKPFYIGPDYERKGFLVYDEQASTHVFSGNYRELLDYRFCGRYSLSDNYHDFTILYIM